MATYSIGSGGGRDYSTVQAWIDDMDATLTENEIGECYNDSEFLSTTFNVPVATFTGHTTGSGTEFILRCATGQSFRDNGSVQTNGLRYNQSNGVAFRTTDNYTQCVYLMDNYVTLDGLQVKADGAHSSVGAIQFLGGRDNLTVQNCIADSNGGAGGINIYGASSKARNCLSINRSAAGTGIAPRHGASLYYCTIVRPSNITPAGTGIVSSYNDPLIQNCAIFGFTTLESGGTNGSSSNNCSDLAISFGSSNQASKTYANQFAQSDASGGVHDFKIVTGSDCKDNGSTDATNGANDIANTARPSGSAYDIGCWEFVAAATGQPASKRMGGVKFTHRYGQW
jgi:hypothetical protein